MREVEISFADRRLFPKSSEYPKFLESWKRMLAWVGLIDQKDWSDFKSFIEIKYNKVSNRSQIILNRILEAIPVADRVISGTNLHKQCFPKHEEASFDEKLKQFRKELDHTVLAVQTYLQHLELRRDTKTQQKLLLNSLNRKNNYELFKEVVDKFEEVLEGEPLNLMQSKDKWELQHLKHNHPSTRTTNHVASALMDTINAFEKFTQLSYLNYYIESLHLNVKLKNEDQRFIESKAEPILNHPGELADFVQLYVLSTKMAQSNQLDEYAEFEKLYKEQHQKLEVTAHLNIVKSMFNLFFNKFSTTGDEKMAEQAFNWMKQAWDLQLYEQQGSINDAEYINFMILTYFLKREELFTQFKKQYEHLLDPGVAEDVKAFCNIRHHFEKSKYNAALTLLKAHFPLGSTTIDPKYDIRVKGLRVMIYLEMLSRDEALDADNEQFRAGEKLDVYDLLINSMNALRQYCSRMRKNLLDERLLIGNQRFVNIVGLFGEYELAKTMADGGSERQKLLKEIQDAMDESRPLAYRLWLKKTFAKLTAQGKPSFPYAVERGS